LGDSYGDEKEKQQVTVSFRANGRMNRHWLYTGIRVKVAHCRIKSEKHSYEYTRIEGKNHQDVQKESASKSNCLP